MNTIFTYAIFGSIRNVNYYAEANEKLVNGDIVTKTRYNFYDANGNNIGVAYVTESEQHIYVNGNARDLVMQLVVA